MPPRSLHLSMIISPCHTITPKHTSMHTHTNTHSPSCHWMCSSKCCCSDSHQQKYEKCYLSCQVSGPHPNHLISQFYTAFNIFFFFSSLLSCSLNHTHAVVKSLLGARQHWKQNKKTEVLTCQSKGDGGVRLGSEIRQKYSTYHSLISKRHFKD